MRRKILALDLGITTGYAVILSTSDERFGDMNGLLGNGEIQEEGFEEELKRIMLMHMPTRSVAERPVVIRGPLGGRLQEIIAATSRVLSRQVEFVDPASWKTSPYKKHPAPQKISPHTRDAIRLGFWYAHKLQGSE